ncbi:hypothetical protein K7X08_022142 [Anisodus acutangulus]|uniref:LIM zinc-binding domain-containing protein n=1 Tax=Anisodus acutangulus TaxID=402998 RepID=A0A9Q1QVB9_9SOLA|nr:hypothetical protein K7X08_022142 [Anisodus acutangulus]
MKDEFLNLAGGARQALRLDKAFLLSLNALATPKLKFAIDFLITVKVISRLASSEPETQGYFVSSYAERKSRFMNWLTKIFKRGSCNRGLPRGQQPQLLGDENMISLDDRSKASKEKEELNRATAVSLTENFRRPGYKCWTDNDEDLGKPLNHDLSSSSYPPPYAPSYGPSEYNPRSYRICSGCHGDIGSGNYLGCMGTFFHPECFICRACGYPITEYEFSLSGNNTYHKSCFREMTHPKCEVCYQFIPTNAAGLIEYRCHPCWSQNIVFHMSMMSPNDAVVVNVWRYGLHGICHHGYQGPLYHAIRDYYEGMNMKIEQQVPMLLVERQALNEDIEGEKHGFHHMPETRGLCHQKSRQSPVLKRPRMGGREVVGIRTHPQKLTRNVKLQLLTGAILAHELMHAWLRLKGFRNLSLEVEEGICQVLSYMWLESEKGVKSGVENKLGEFFMHQIAHDTSPAYGGGFRAANEAVNKYGLRCTLDHIRLTGSFPL